MHGNQVYHRDLKPANILMSDKFDIKITDFGLACNLDADKKSREFCGTLTFMAPEIWYGDYLADSADLFAVGVIIFYMFSGHYPFRMANVHDPCYMHLMQQ
jgi:serine/threonine protein kinase